MSYDQQGSSSITPIQFVFPELNLETPQNQDIQHEQTVQCVGNSSDRIFIPAVTNSIRPVLGMEFETLDAAYDFYNLYAKEAGFSVRKSSDKKNADKIITYKRLVCHRQGDTDNKASKKGQPLTKLFPHSRAFCKALITLRLNDKGGYYISEFVEGHSHPLSTPSKTRFLRSHRNISTARKKLIDSLDDSNIRPAQQMTIFESQTGGYENIGFIDKDVQNYRRDKREETKGLDAQMLYDYFQDKADRNSSFTYVIKVDNAKRITHVFWADGIARANYSRFGSVVSFDTTYKTNRYDMIFAPFTGVNHHGRSVVMGCGFLPKETAEDFVWLFEQWQKAMPGDPPKCIITDQDLGMTKAIAQVFPSATHRYCIWHIMDKAHKHVSTTGFTHDFNKAFQKVVYHPETPEEFEESWFDFVEKFKLQDNSWLRDLYEMRERWIPAYLRDKFFAGMQSTQRSETINKFLKQHVHKSNSFCDFMLRYERFIGRQRHREVKDEHETLSTRPRLLTASSVESQMAKIYTRKVFFKFQLELFKFIACKLEIISSNALETTFRVHPAPRNDDEQDYKKDKKYEFDRIRKVVLQKGTSYASCSCRMFEFEGIPCRHILSVLLKQADIQEMPKQLIVERWTRSAKEGDVLDKDGTLVMANADASLVSRHSTLSQLSSALSDEGCLTKESYEYTFQTLSSAYRNVRDMNSKMGATARSGPKKRKETPLQLEFHEPTRCRTKGSGKRFKPIREKVRTKVRKCHLCNKREGHNKRTCPLLRDLSLQTIQAGPSGEISADYQESEEDSTSSGSSGPEESTDRTGGLNSSVHWEGYDERI